jgi:hypothetical protein
MGTNVIGPSSGPRSCIELTVQVGATIASGCRANGRSAEGGHDRPVIESSASSAACCNPAPSSLAEVITKKVNRLWRFIFSDRYGFGGGHIVLYTRDVTRLAVLAEVAEGPRRGSSGAADRRSFAGRAPGHER